MLNKRYIHTVKQFSSYSIEVPEQNKDKLQEHVCVFPDVSFRMNASLKAIDTTTLNEEEEKIQPQEQKIAKEEVITDIIKHLYKMVKLYITKMSKTRRRELKSHQLYLLRVQVPIPCVGFTERRVFNDTHVCYKCESLF